MGNWCGKRASKLRDEPQYQYISPTNYDFNFESMIQFKKTPITNDYRFEELMGKGASADVYKAVSISGEFHTAIKKIKRRANNEKLAAEFMNQLTILKSLDHPNILKIYDIYEQQDNFYIVSELCTGGELFDQISLRKTFTELSASVFFYQILETVRYLHDNRIMHRDVKPQNLLLSDTSSKAYLKLIDFGSACAYEDSEPKPRRRVGTSYYVAPEVLKRVYNEKCDVWSCGIILYILLCGEPPFKGKDDKEVLSAIQLGKFTFSKDIWKHISKEAKDLISNMLEYDYQKRCTIKEAMEHPWLETRTKASQLAPKPEDLKNCLQNMRNFHSLKKMQQAVLMFIVNFLISSEEKQKMMICFKTFDLNGDGVISREELTYGYGKFLGGLDIDREVQKIINAIDKNHSGAIDFSEFVMACMKIEDLLSQDKIQRAFRLLDKDGSGTLSIHQFKVTLGENIPAEYYQELLKELGLKGQGQISKDEFIKSIKRVTIAGH